MYIHPVFSRILLHYLRPPCEAILDKILIRGARTHNLKNIDLTLPRDKLIVITGLSGAGKSSLAFDTLAWRGSAPHPAHTACR